MGILNLDRRRRLAERMALPGDLDPTDITLRTVQDIVGPARWPYVVAALTNEVEQICRERDREAAQMASLDVNYQKLAAHREATRNLRGLLRRWSS